MDDAAAAAAAAQVIEPDAALEPVVEENAAVALAPEDPYVAEEEQAVQDDVELEASKRNEFISSLKDTTVLQELIQRAGGTTH